MHFYPHGFELLAAEIPLAGAIAKALLRGLAAGALVSPSCMSDRYVFYRVPELLQSYLDHTAPAEDAQLPYQRADFKRYFPNAKISAVVAGDVYAVANLAKGGVIRAYNRRTGALILSDCGLIGRCADGSTVTSQWVTDRYDFSVNETGWEVSGPLQQVQSTKLFSPSKLVVFRLALITLGWSPRFSHFLKRRIRATLIRDSESVSLVFHRRFSLTDSTVTVRDEIKGDAKLESLWVGGDFFVRYVPQSQFFQPQELDTSTERFSSEQLAALHSGQTISRTVQVTL